MPRRKLGAGPKRMRRTQGPKRSKLQNERLHAERRAFQRYGVAMSRVDIIQLVEAIQKGRVECEYRQSNRVRRIVMHVPKIGDGIPLVYDSKRNEIVTFLPMNEAEIIRAQVAGAVARQMPEDEASHILPDEDSSDRIPDMLFCDFFKSRKASPARPEADRIYAKTGETVTCENGHPIVDFAQTVLFGDRFNASVQLTNWRQSIPQRGQSPLPVCETCGARFCAGMSGDILHFADGWRVHNRYDPV